MNKKPVAALTALVVLLAPLFLYVAASAALGTYQWARDHDRCASGGMLAENSVGHCLYRREHERHGLFHAWGSNFRAED